LSAFGLRHVMQAVTDYAGRFPDETVDMTLSDRVVDLIEEGYDVAVRAAPNGLKSSSLVARQIATAHILLVASPEYVAHAGTPGNVADLEHHLCLPFMLPSSGRIAPWVFRDGDQDIDWLPASNVALSDDVLGVVSMAQSGAGICQTYDFI
ncbi:substrate binding domain-containing protein, partial [Micrococcus luteus]|nr:substrate binding domain-containing protein [Micrococcus luteus]